MTIIYQESTRLSQLITDILALSQADSQNNSVQTVHLAKLVASVEASLQQQITQKQVHVMTEIPEDLTLQIDEMRLSQIIRNLLTNAIFYNHEAGNVLISATQKSNQQVELVVQDNGIGIESDEQQRIFERFYRVDKARSRNNGGTGLGLAIVAELVAKLDGKIQVNSQLGVGTRFVITLPNE
ncbi:sensor histidine kinase [Lacticaseibacillus saniviri]|uniref:sensor histidine kinase n=1 Tax=Lacticaseibacillus saniviri TaxID=931533 RepID=UPI000AA40499|nr:ATP-binding protein [Lacticaseibacillus saniviri]